jgi:TusA-related sulfurtransferase
MGSTASDQGIHPEARMSPAAFAAYAFLDALLRLDFLGLKATLDPGVRFRALAPGEIVDVATASEAVQCFRRWFGDKTDLELLHQKGEALIDRFLFEYRLRLRNNGQPYLIEQRLCCDVENGRFAAIDLVCSGFRPEGVLAAEASVHRFDAGELGCGSGLPREFRTRIGQIPVGHILEVVTKDPSAKEDLPSMARLLGHSVRSIDVGADGEFRIRVERAK